MLDILAQNRAQMVFAEDEHVIEAFASHAPEEALACCVHQRRLHRGLQDTDPCSLRNPVELGAELVVAVTDDEFVALIEGRELPQLLRCPSRVG